VEEGVGRGKGSVNLGVRIKATVWTPSSHELSGSMVRWWGRHGSFPRSGLVPPLVLALDPVYRALHLFYIGLN